ncbi:MAG: MBL fold metallo-hydrolase [Rubripirellula sp.]
MSGRPSVDTHATSVADQGISFLLERDPKIGIAFQVADGIWGVRLPIELTMEHVNVYLLKDGDDWTLVDAGCHTTSCQNALHQALDAAPFEANRITKVIVTHYHPDHIGMAGYFAQRGAMMITSRVCWLAAQLLRSSQSTNPTESHLEFMRRAGMPEMELASFSRRSPSNYARLVSEIPDHYCSIREGDSITIGNRQWRIVLGNGHANDHVTLWSDDGIALVGDQILPAVSPSLSVHFSEPMADRVGEWLADCGRFEQIATDQTLCLPGHHRPFTGAPYRCRQLADNCRNALSRLTEALAKPMTAYECLKVIYRREVSPREQSILIGESIAYLNHLLLTGVVSRRQTPAGAYLWHRKAARVHAGHRTPPVAKSKGGNS